jgi:hypothetical protein
MTAAVAADIAGSLRDCDARRAAGCARVHAEALPPGRLRCHTLH